MPPTTTSGWHPSQLSPRGTPLRPSHKVKQMHEVRCETCEKVLGIITDEKWGGKRIYKAVETVVLGTDGAFIDGELQASRGTYCTDHAPQGSEQPPKEPETETT